MARIKALEISTVNSGFNFPLANSPSGQIQLHSIWVSIFLTLSISCHCWKMVSLHTVLQDHVGRFRWSKERMYICKQATLVQGIKLSQHINTTLFDMKKKNLYHFFKQVETKSAIQAQLCISTAKRPDKRLGFPQVKCLGSLNDGFLLGSPVQILDIAGFLD